MWWVQSHVTSSLEVTPYCWMAVIIIFIVHVLVATYARPVSDILTSNGAFLIYGWMVRPSRPQPHAAAFLDTGAELCHVLMCGCQILAVDLFCYSIVAAMHRRVLLRVRPTFH